MPDGWTDGPAGEGDADAVGEAEEAEAGAAGADGAEEDNIMLRPLELVARPHLKPDRNCGAKYYLFRRHPTVA